MMGAALRCYLVGTSVNVVPVTRLFLPLLVCSYVNGDEVRAFLFRILDLVHTGYTVFASRIADSDEAFPLLDYDGYAGI